MPGAVDQRLEGLKAGARDYIDGQRFETVAEVAHAVGLSPSYFSRRFRQAYACEEIRL